jgi:DNA-binding IclR family transcriptional regulator
MSTDEPKRGGTEPHYLHPKYSGGVAKEVIKALEIGKPTTAAPLAKRLGLPEASVASSLRHMERNGWLEASGMPLQYYRTF